VCEPLRIVNLGPPSRTRSARYGVAAACRRLPLRARGGYGRAVPAARFVTDASLQFVARRLRFMGYDVAVFPGARLEELFDAARRDQRTVLSLSRRHPRAHADVPLLTVPADPASAVRTIAAAHEPGDPPFTRCPACGASLQTRHPMEARGEVPGRVLRTSRELRYCPVCGKWYWDGTHVAKIRAWLDAALRG
jgi:uncharacterized protein with PIN domain